MISLIEIKTKIMITNVNFFKPILFLRLKILITFQFKTVDTCFDVLEITIMIFRILSFYELPTSGQKHYNNLEK